MFNSVILDVIIGLIAAFLAVSLVTSAVVEAIASIWKLRSGTLVTGIMNLLNDDTFTGLAAQLYAHALINPRGPGPADASDLKMLIPSTAPQLAGIEAKLKALATRLKTNAPAYIQKEQFAEAFADVLNIAHTAQGEVPTRQQMLDAIGAAVPAEKNPQINQLLTSIVLRCNGDLKAIKTSLAGWFDNAMDRVGGAYKRRIQFISFFIAIVVSIVMNADAVHLAQGIWAQPAAIQALKAPGALPASNVDIKAFTDTLPLGWPNGFWTFDAKGKGPQTSAVVSLFGWLISAFATLFGAPFWFDLLQQFVRLKGTGPSPTEKVQNTAAAG